MTYSDSAYNLENQTDANNSAMTKSKTLQGIPKEYSNKEKVNGHIPDAVVTDPEAVPPKIPPRITKR